MPTDSDAGGVGPDAFRAVAGSFVTGITAVTAAGEEGPVGMTVQSFCSLSLEPPLFLLCVARTSTTWPAIERAGRLVVNLLSEEQGSLARQFAGPSHARFSDIGWSPAPLTGAPILDGALGWIEGHVEQISEGGDHWIVICSARGLSARREGRPAVYFRSRVHGIAHA